MQKAGIPKLMRCLQCGNKVIIRRVKNKKKGHVKPLWCYVCKERTKHLELN